MKRAVALALVGLCLLSSFLFFPQAAQGRIADECFGNWNRCRMRRVQHGRFLVQDDAGPDSLRHRPGEVHPLLLSEKEGPLRKRGPLPPSFIIDGISCEESGR